MRLIDADALTEFLKCLLPERGMWEIEGDTGKNAVCETVAEAIEMVKNMETIQPEKAQFSLEGTTKGTTSDTISKTETVERLRRMLEATVPNTDYDEGFIDGVEFGISTVSTIPTVQPEPHEGEWVNGRCNKCGGHAPFWAMASTYYKSDFCPKCGAKMKGVTK